MSHQDIWLGIERLATQNGLSTSGLAKKAGLDATSFNKSKRVMSDGRLRWPSTESIVRILEATGTDWSNFITLMTQEGADKQAHKQNLPLLPLNKIHNPALFTEEGLPKGSKWDELIFPDFEASTVFMLEIMGDQFLPFYKDGDRLIISPKAQPRRGDRIFVRSTQGEVSLVQFYRLTTKGLETHDLYGKQELLFKLENISVSGRILWASQ